jgi:hypothetical protein
VIGEITCISVRPGAAAAAGPAIAATAGEYSSDEMLVERIAAGDKLAMQVLFARHRTNIYRWLLRFLGNEIVAEDLLSDVFFDVWEQAGRPITLAEHLEQKLGAGL